MEVQDRRRFQHDRRADHAGTTHKKRPHAGEDSIRCAEVWRASTGAIQDQKLLLDQKRLGDHGASAAGAHQPSQCGDEVNQQDDQVAHRDILATIPRITRLDISTDCGTD